MELKNKKLLFLYRSKLFYKVKFTTKDKDLTTIVNALNIKNKKKRYEYVYNEAIKYVNKYYEKDFCNFIDGKCISQRKSGSKYRNGCCRRCPIVTDHGCPSENFACKLIYCKSAIGNFKLLKLKDIDILKTIPISRRMIMISDFFKTKEEILKDLNSNILLYAFRNIFSEIKLSKYRMDKDKNDKKLYN